MTSPNASHIYELIRAEPMRISVITATYNCSKTLPTTLESIAAQTHVDIEHFVIDGGSTDDTANLVRSWTAHPLSFVSERDKGIYDALNKGVARASGEVIGFLHADDVLQDEHVLEKVARAFADPAVQAVYGDLVYVAQEDLGRVIRTWHSGEFKPRRLAQGWMPPHPTFYARRSLYERLGAFDLRYRIAADYDCMLRFLKDDGIDVAYIPEILVRMRTGGVSNRSLRNILQKSGEDLSIVRRNRVGGLWTIALKNLSKIQQFLPRAGRRW
jgi:glycosyltransferase